MKEHPDSASLLLLLKAREAADALRISLRTLHSLTVPNGDIPVVRVGGSVRYLVSDLKAYCDRNRDVGSKSEDDGE